MHIGQAGCVERIARIAVGGIIRRPRGGVRATIDRDRARAIGIIYIEADVIIARTAKDAVARCCNDAVVTRAAINRVAAETTKDRIDASATQNAVVPGTAVDAVVVDTGCDGVVTSAAVEHDATGFAIRCVRPVPPVIGVAAVNLFDVVVWVYVEVIVDGGRTRVNHVPARATINGVVAATNQVERIVAVAANQAVVACAADDAVVARAAIDRVVSHACIHGIITRTG